MEASTRRAGAASPRVHEPRRPGRPAPDDRATDDACRTCYGSGLERYTDDGGDVLNRDCTSCAGSGFR